MLVEQDWMIRASRTKSLHWSKGNSGEGGMQVKGSDLCSGKVGVKAASDCVHFVQYERRCERDT